MRNFHKNLAKKHPQKLLKMFDASEGKPIKTGKFIAEMARIFVVSKQQMLNKLKACDLVDNNYKL